MASLSSEKSIEIQVASRKGPVQTIVALKDASQDGNAITRETFKALGFGRLRISLRDGGARIPYWKIELTWTCNSVDASVRQDFQIKKTLPAAIVLGRVACHMLADAEQRGDEEREVLPVTKVKMTEEEKAAYEAKLQEAKEEKAKREEAKIAELEKAQQSNQAAPPARRQG